MPSRIVVTGPVVAGPVTVAGGGSVAAIEVAWVDLELLRQAVHYRAVREASVIERLDALDTELRRRVIRVTDEEKV